MSKIFSGHQPNFLPYMGFFYKLYCSDIFVLDDDVQFSTKNYQNFNSIKVNDSPFRVTIPVTYEFGQKINEVQICYTRNWNEKLLKTLQMSYKKAAHFEEAYSFAEKHFMFGYERLAEMNIAMIKELADRLSIETEIVIASETVPTTLMNNDRNIYQCVKLGGDVYLSGIGGKEYNDESAYAENGIKVVYTDYQAPKYRQVGREFIPNLSVLDYIFNQGFVLPEDWRK